MCKLVAFYMLLNIQVSLVVTEEDSYLDAVFYRYNLTNSKRNFKLKYYESSP